MVYYSVLYISQRRKRKAIQLVMLVRLDATPGARPKRCLNKILAQAVIAKPPATSRQELVHKLLGRYEENSMMVGSGLMKLVKRGEHGDRWAIRLSFFGMHIFI